MRGASRLAVRPTARGWQALVIGLLVLFLARMIGTTQLHQLAYALLALLLAALVLAWAGSRGLRYSRALPPGTHITAGRPASIRLLLERSGSSKVSVVDRLPEPRLFEAPPLGETRIEAPLTFARRGVYELGPAEVWVTDSFGLLRFVRRFEERTEVVVYPEVHDLPGFPLVGGNVEVGARGAHGQRGDEFAGLREGIRTLEAEVEDAVSAAASVLTHLRRERLPSRLVCVDRAGAATQFGSGEASY